MINEPSIPIEDRFLGCLLGLACGDALGTTLEFQPRGSFTPITSITGGGPFNLAPGEWTDDTSMALCLATSLIKTGGFNVHDQMERYCRWQETGYLSSTGHCFDIGNTVAAALHRFRQDDNPYAGDSDPFSAGNGSIMRLAPVVLFYFPDEAKVIHYAIESSSTTHAAQECLDACHLLAEILYRALKGMKKSQVLFDSAAVPFLANKIAALALGEYCHKTEEQIRGSGYVVESLEAALWCFLHTDNYKEAVLRAANLGDDADTTAAVCGQLAGAYYGVKAIPLEWLELLSMRELITQLALACLDRPSK